MSEKSRRERRAVALASLGHLFSVAVSHYKGDRASEEDLAAAHRRVSLLIGEFESEANAAESATAQNAEAGAVDAASSVGAQNSDLRRALTKAEQSLETVKGERSAHDKSIGTFLAELHAILVDPLAEGTITVDEMRTTLIKAAIRDRDAIASLSQELETVKVERDEWKHRADALFNGDVAKALASIEETDLRARAAERLAYARGLNRDQRWSITYGELPPSVMPLIESHIWDNKNISEQRDWALQQLVLALAHDMQPYPTAEAYESVCQSRREWQTRAEQAERELHKIQKMAKSLTIEDAIAAFGEATDTLSWFKAIAAARLAQVKAEAEIRQLRHDCGELADLVAQHAKVLAEKNALAYDKMCLHENIAARSDRLRALVVEARRRAPTFGVQEWEWLLVQLQGLVEK